MLGVPNIVEHEKCESYLLFRGETTLGDTFRALLYFLGLAYCFVGLSAITARFFRSMENVVKHTREVVKIDPCTHNKIIRHEKVWNYTIADISLLAFGTSFPQISLATIDAIRNMGNIYAGGLGPGTRWFCCIRPFPYPCCLCSSSKSWRAEKDCRYGSGCTSFWSSRGERPEEWVPEEIACNEERHEYKEYFEIIHDEEENNDMYVRVPQTADAAETSNRENEMMLEKTHLVTLWKRQFMDAMIVFHFMLESKEASKLDNIFIHGARISWQMLLSPWRLLFAIVPPCHIAHGWVSFICTLLFISGIAYIVTKFTDLISCVTGINAYVIAFTALASGTSWPDLVASKIAAERQLTADSAIANIICSNSVNIYVGIGVPWLIDNLYNFVAYGEPLRINNAKGLSFSLLVFFCTSVGCITVLVFSRFIFGAELGGPRLGAWITCVYFMLLWIIFVMLSSLKFSGII